MSMNSIDKSVSEIIWANRDLYSGAARVIEISDDVVKCTFAVNGASGRRGYFYICWEEEALEIATRLSEITGWECEVKV